MNDKPAEVVSLDWERTRRLWRRLTRGMTREQRQEFVRQWLLGGDDGIPVERKDHEEG